MLESLIDKVDTLVVGGAMAFTFLMARGLNVGASIVEVEQLDAAKVIQKLPVLANGWTCLGNTRPRGFLRHEESDCHPVADLLVSVQKLVVFLSFTSPSPSLGGPSVMSRHIFVDTRAYWNT